MPEERLVDRHSDSLGSGPATNWSEPAPSAGIGVRARVYAREVLARNAAMRDRLVRREAHDRGHCGFGESQTGTDRISGVERLRHTVETGERRPGKGQQDGFETSPVRHGRCRTSICMAPCR